MIRTIVLTLVVVALASLGTQPAMAQKPLLVGSKIDTEGALLGKMIVLLLRHHGLEVQDRTELGGTPIVRQAILSGQVDIYPEYTGNGAVFFPEAPADIWKDARKAYATVKEMDAKNGLVWLPPSPANNTWAIAVNKELTGKGVRSMEDLARHLSQGGRVKLAACDEFVERPDALPAFAKAYGFNLSKEQILILSGCNTAQTEQAAAQGIDGVNAAMAYGTDGGLAALGLTVLADPKSVQPVYAPAPLVRREALERFPSMEAILPPVFSDLDQKTLQELNARIAIEGLDAESVARDYLTSRGYIH